METDYDCQDNVCSGAPVDIKVVKVTPFPGYNEMNKFNGDIALLKLHRSVTFTGKTSALIFLEKFYTFLTFKRI